VLRGCGHRLSHHEWSAGSKAAGGGLRVELWVGVLLLILRKLLLVKRNLLQQVLMRVQLKGLLGIELTASLLYPRASVYSCLGISSYRCAH
jgi:hypothetical protein